MQMESEYLKRPLIKDVSYEISEDHVTIQSPHTCFVKYILPSRCRKDVMLDQYKRILRMAKEQGAKISYSRHIRKIIREQWPDYIAGREKQEQLFQELRDAADVVRQRGIHLGCSDDEALEKVREIEGSLNEISFSIEAMRNIPAFERKLRMLEQRLSSGQGHYDMITL